MRNYLEVVAPYMGTEPYLPALSSPISLIFASKYTGNLNYETLLIVQGPLQAFWDKNVFINAAF